MTFEHLLWAVPVVVGVSLLVRAWLCDIDHDAPESGFKSTDGIDFWENDY